MGLVIGDLLRDARLRLRATSHAPAAREAALILAHVLGWTEAQVIARDDRFLEEEAATRYEALLARRLAGEPYAYLVGEREFYGRVFAVDSRVLIPRPETEHLIETCLALDLPPEPRILDVGTGSGCIGVTLALEIPGSSILAVDRSLAAAVVARANARRLAAATVRTAVADLTRGLSLAVFDLVVSNPPYVAPRLAPELSPEITDHEPHSALFAGGEGLEVYRRLYSELAGLAPDTPFVCEIGDGQAESLLDLARSYALEPVEAARDFAGIPRVVVINKN